MESHMAKTTSDAHTRAQARYYEEQGKRGKRRVTRWIPIERIKEFHTLVDKLLDDWATEETEP